MDRTTKALLFVIALGLWANVATAWVAPVQVSAQDLSPLDSKNLASIADSLEKLVGSSITGMLHAKIDAIARHTEKISQDAVYLRTVERHLLELVLRQRR